MIVQNIKTFIFRTYRAKGGKTENKYVIDAIQNTPFVGSESIIPTILGSVKVCLGIIGMVYIGKVFPRMTEIPKKRRLTLKFETFAIVALPDGLMHITFLYNAYIFYLYGVNSHIFLHFFVIYAIIIAFAGDTVNFSKRRNG